MIKSSSASAWMAWVRRRRNRLFVMSMCVVGAPPPALKLRNWSPSSPLRLVAPPGATVCVSRRMKPSIVNVKVTSVLTMSMLLVSENEISLPVIALVPDRFWNSMPLSCSSSPAPVMVLLANTKSETLMPVMPFSTIVPTR